MVEYTTEVINISKIKEGFYVGDQIAATNLDVIIQFKLTHMINATGTQIINKWETIGIKYLTLNWSETPTQNLFDSKDEIANRIVAFIDDSFNRGEGLLAHSVRGQNRVCIVVIIYLMKKYKWNLNKCMDFLRSKKQDVDIPKYFLNQLILFENRLTKKGEGIKSIPWTEENLPDPEEKLLRNTYVNSLPTNASMIPKELINVKERKHIAWADSNPYKKEVLCHVNAAKDLFFQRDVKPVTAHRRLKPSRSCMKNRSRSMGDMKRSNSKGNVMDNAMGYIGITNPAISSSYNGYNVNNIKTISQQNVKRSESANSNNTNQMMMNIRTSNTNSYNNNNVNLTASMMTMLNNNFINNNINSMNTNNLATNATRGLVPNQRSITVNTNTSISNLSSSATISNPQNQIGMSASIQNPNMKFINPSTSELLGNYSSLYGTQKQQIENKRPNHFQSQPQPQQRSQSYSQNENNNLSNLRGSYNINTANSLNPNNIKNYSIMKENNSNMLSQEKQKIIITNNYEHIVNNNINNIYINPDSFNSNQQKTNANGNIIKLPNEKIEPTIGPIPNIQFSNTPSVNVSINNNNYRPKERKIAKTSENQRPMANNFISGITNTNVNYLTPSNNNNTQKVNERKFKIIDYSSNTPNYNPTTKDINYFSPTNPSSQQNKNQFLYNTMNQPSYIPIQPSNQISQTNKPLNNYNPNLNKKNTFNNNNNALFNRPSTGGAMHSKGPIKIKNDSIYGKKPSTPDQFGHLKTNHSNKNNNTYYGTMKKRDPINNRPSTAPQKDKNPIGNVRNSNNQINRHYNGVNKRLPSPNLSSSNSLSKTQKITSAKYRAQSPMIKSNMTMGTIKRGTYHGKMF